MLPIPMPIANGWRTAEWCTGRTGPTGQTRRASRNMGSGPQLLGTLFPQAETRATPLSQPHGAAGLRTAASAGNLLVRETPRIVFRPRKTTAGVGHGRGGLRSMPTKLRLLISILLEMVKDQAKYSANAFHCPPNRDNLCETQNTCGYITIYFDFTSTLPNRV